MANLGAQDRSASIASDRVEGTAVYNPTGERLGSISRLMIGKRDGQVQCAVLSFGGFLGIGNDHYPLPWSMLHYDLDKGGYVVDLQKDKLKDAPSYDLGREPEFDEEYTRALYTYYGVNPLF